MLRFQTIPQAKGQKKEEEKRSPNYLLLHTKVYNKQSLNTISQAKPPQNQLLQSTSDVGKCFLGKVTGCFVLRNGKNQNWK